MKHNPYQSPSKSTEAKTRSKRNWLTVYAWVNCVVLALLVTFLAIFVFSSGRAVANELPRRHASYDREITFSLPAILTVFAAVNFTTFIVRFVALSSAKTSEPIGCDDYESN